MKEILSIIFAAALVLGIGNGVLAHGNSEGAGTFNFGQIKPFMKEMHPDLTEKELKDMYNTCHGTTGAAPSKNFQQMEHDKMIE